MTPPRIKRSFTAAFATFAAIAVGLFAIPATAATNGTVNRSFGADGIAHFPIANAVVGNAVTDSQGRVIVTGWATQGGFRSLVVARYLRSGALDPSFGANGFTTLGKKTTDAGPVNGVGAIMPDDRIVVVGSFPGTGDIVVWRLHANGTLDHSFNGTGRSAPVIGFGATVALDGAGRALVTGTGTTSPVIWRFTKGGKLDTSFATGGIDRLHLGSQATVFGITVDSSQRMIVTGLVGNSKGYVARLHPNGTLDTGFGTQGKTVIGETFQLASVTIQPDGRIVAAGATTGVVHMAAVRLLANGARDTSFGTNGVAVVQPQGRTSSANDIAVAPNGTLILGGLGSNTTDEEAPTFAIAARLLPNGRIDRTFACGGVAWLRFGTGRSLVVSVVVTHESAILAGIAVADAFGDNPSMALSRVDLGPSAPGGYAMATDRGGIDGFGSAPACPSVDDLAPSHPIVGIATTPSGHGDWLTATDGGVFSVGDAHFYGSTGAMHLNQPTVGMAATKSGNGYWLVARDGGIFTFGDADFHGSTGGMHLNQPIVGMAATKSGKGYWLVASDGGVFTFGDAAFHGSTGAMHLNQPIVGMAATKSGSGYWLVARDGGIFTFGDAAFHGSTGAMHLNQPIIGMAATPSGKGYWLVARDGGVFTFGDATFRGGGVQLPAHGNFVGVAPTP